jgi:hypothetical protein
MDVTLLKQLKQGDSIDLGRLFPGVDDTEVRWHCQNVVDGTRETNGETAPFRMAEFNLSVWGVSLGDVRAYENEDGGISWEAVK